jgi:hypothetical protein
MESGKVVYVPRQVRRPAYIDSAAGPDERKRPCHSGGRDKAGALKMIIIIEKIVSS